MPPVQGESHTQGSCGGAHSHMQDTALGQEATRLSLQRHGDQGWALGQGGEG